MIDARLAAAKPPSNYCLIIIHISDGCALRHSYADL